MAQKLLSMSLRRLVNAPIGSRAFSNAEKVGKREVVGYGVNGMPVYVDRVDYPMPAIRFREETKEILVSVNCQQLNFKINKHQLMYGLNFVLIL